MLSAASASQKAHWGFVFNPTPTGIHRRMKAANLSRAAILVYMHIVEALNGKTKNGCTIPQTDAQIAQALGISVWSVRTARRELIAKGFIEQRAYTVHGNRVVATRVFRLLHTQPNCAATVKKLKAQRKRAAEAHAEATAEQNTDETAQPHAEQAQADEQARANAETDEHAQDTGETDEHAQANAEPTPPESQPDAEPEATELETPMSAEPDDLGNERLEAGMQICIPGSTEPDKPKTVEILEKEVQNCISFSGADEPTTGQPESVETPTQDWGESPQENVANRYKSLDVPHDENPDTERVSEVDNPSGKERDKDRNKEPLSPNPSLHTNPSQPDTGERERDDLANLFYRTCLDRPLLDERKRKRINRDFDRRIRDIAADNRVGSVEQARELLIDAISRVKKKVAPIWAHTVMGTGYGEQAIEEAIQAKLSSPVSDSSIDPETEPSTQTETESDEAPSPSLNSSAAPVVVDRSDYADAYTYLEAYCQANAHRELDTGESTRLFRETFAQAQLTPDRIEQMHAQARKRL